MDFLGQPLLHSSSVAPSNASLPPALVSRALPNHAQVLHEIPHYNDVVFNPLEMAGPFPLTVQLPSGVDVES